MGFRPEDTSIDRIDGTRGYEPGNCRWATIAEQQRNLKTNRTVVFQGCEILLCDLAANLGLNSGTLSYRIAAGWPEEEWGVARWGGNRFKAGK